MTKVAFCFPGQGSLEVGMGREIAEAVPEAMEVYRIGSEVTGMDLAHRCAAAPLADRAAAEMRAAGGRPRRRAAVGADALTAGERRVAEMATEGISNKEIAQSLFVTLRTVEMHLSHAYGKLGIRSRQDLAKAMAAKDS